MQYAVNTPDEYMNALENDWRRETLIELKRLLHELAPELTESIAYGMLSFDDAEGGVFALNAQKGYVSFYVGNIDTVDPDGELLAGLNRGKGCIRFSKTRKVAGTRIREFIDRAIKLRRQGTNIDC